MTSDIQPLSSEVVHRIAAGEVIDSLAAAVRELVDNAIDAGATRIVVSVWPQEWRLRVADNGGGIDYKDLQQAAAPHTTSKIRSTADLGKITSLGFRGEALHSLAQLGNLEIYSRPASETSGWHAVYDPQGEVVEIETTAIAPGTVVAVTNLFQDWPARRQGLPPLAQQVRAVQMAVYQSALCHPQITWQVQQSDRPWFVIAAGKTAQEILPQLLAAARPEDLQAVRLPVPSLETEIEPEIEPGIKSGTGSIEVVLGLPDRCHRHRPDWVQVAVNGRCVKVGSEETAFDPLVQTILNAFRQTLPRHRYPVCFVHLRLAPEQIDWHRHPAKAEIYLRQLGFWQQQVTQAIQQALGQLSETAPSSRIEQLFQVSEAKGFYNLSDPLQPGSEDSAASLAEPSLTQLRAVAQIHQTYILAEHPAGLWLVEQHIAHERVLYEALCQEWQLVDMNPPLTLKHLTSAQVEQLQALDMTVEPFGNDLWAVRTAPKLLAEREDCPQALQELSLAGNVQAALVATACRSAIRNGTALDLAQMQTLLEAWQRTRHPRTCPHGRPIHLALEEAQLARFFRRHWVIGKSHGI